MSSAVSGRLDIMRRLFSAGRALLRRPRRKGCAESVPTRRGACCQMADNKLSIKMNETLLELLEGDITELDVEVLVNAANDRLQLGGGVAGAIRRKGGAAIQEECNRIGGTPVGTAVITGAGKLKAKHVIHAVGPRMGDGDEDRKLASAVRSALALADRHQLRSIAIPAISTG